MSEQSGHQHEPNPLLRIGHITELEEYSALLIRIRWFVGLLVILATAVSVYAARLPLPGLALFTVGAVILLGNVGLAAYQRRLRRAAGESTRAAFRWFLQFQIALDWVLLTVFLHLTGGITSPAIPVLLVHVAMAAMLLPEFSTVFFLLVGLLVLAGLAWLERVGILPHYDILAIAPQHLHLQPVFIASQLAFLTLTALVVVYLISQTVRQLRRREKQVAGLLQSAQAISSTLNLPDVLEHLTSNAAHMLGKPGASIRLLNESGDELVMSASYGLSQTYLEKGPVSPASSPLDRDALLGRPIIIEETESDARIQYPKQIVEEGIRSVLVVPILGRVRTLGVLRVYEAVPGGFNPDDVSLATAIAQQGAVAIENALAHDELQLMEADRASYLRVVTHELRAPVAGAQSLLRTLLKGSAGEINETQADILRRIERRLDNFISLVEDMLALSASKTIPIADMLEPVSLEDVLMQEVDRFAKEADAQGITLRSHIQTQDTTVIATSDGLSRVFGNLIHNAIKYSPAGASVQVDVERHDTYVNVEVCDDGMGIAEEDLPRIWKEFFRSRKVRRTEISGTGLGLAIVKELVTRFRGIISVESEEGVGTTFVVTLPLADHSLGDAAALEQKPSAAPEA